MVTVFAVELEDVDIEPVELVPGVEEDVEA